MVLLKNSRPLLVASNGKVGMDSSKLLRGLGANGAWPSLAMTAQVPALGRNWLSSLSHDKQLGLNGISEKSLVEAAEGSTAGERIQGRPAAVHYSHPPCHTELGL